MSHMKEVIISDLDGVLAASNPDAFPFNQPAIVWDAMQGHVREVLRDLHCIEPTCTIWRMLVGSPSVESASTIGALYESWIITSRYEIFREVTEDWLSRHRIPFSKLVMQPVNKFRHGIEFKKFILDSELYNRHIALALEDRTIIVREYRKRGILTFQTTDGDF